MNDITEIINLKRKVYKETEPSISKTDNYIQEDGTITKMVNIILPESYRPLERKAFGVFELHVCG